MKYGIDLPWERYGLIAELAAQLSDRSPQFGKTVLQKIVFLLDKIYNVNLGYEFNLYTHGPFSAELLNDLDYTQTLGGVQVKYVQSGGYKILPGTENKTLRERADEFLSDKKQIIEKIVEEFGSFSAKELELQSTIIFVDQDMKRGGELANRDEFIKIVSDIKPHFSEEAIRSTLDRLKRKGYLTSV